MVSLKTNAWNGNISGLGRRENLNELKKYSLNKTSEAEATVRFKKADREGAI